jgi:type I restriction enzyme M protein
MTDQESKKLGDTLWKIADQLRGAMNADDFRDYMLAFLFLRYLSENYELAAAKELGPDYPALGAGDKRAPLSLWYAANPDDTATFETQMRRKVHYVIRPEHLWTSIVELARVQDGALLETLQAGMKYIEEESFQSTFRGLFSEINLSSEKLGKTYPDRNTALCRIITEIANGLRAFSTNSDTLGDAYEYLIGQFAAGSGKKAGEFYTPQFVSDILSAIVQLDGQEPATGPRAAVQLSLGAERCDGRRRALQEPRTSAQIRRRFRLPAPRVSLPEARWGDGDHPAAWRLVPWRRRG